jgi:16S rRNA (cytosine1402-N4)-methyltransferase
MEEYHVPVLLNPSVDALVHDPNGIYADATFGGGGHSRAILKKLSAKGKLISFDRDDDALANAPDDKRFTLVNHNFRFLKQFMRYGKMLPISGILADLGISSHQINVGERGFAHRLEGPLDMRMDTKSLLSAADIINTYPEDRLKHIFKMWGEIPNAGRLASLICQSRTGQDIITNEQFKKIIAPCTPKQSPAKYLSQVYQALRIEVNGEMQALESLLKASADCIGKGGHLVIISYHSLEDRMVKNFLQTGNLDGIRQTDIYGNVERPFDPEPNKAIVPDEQEIASNKRARSAKMRIGVKR